MLDDFEKAAQKWERLLFTSGGALEMSKCLWYCLHWYWDADGREQATIFGKDGPELKITRGMDKEVRTAIERREVTQSHKTLGVRLEPLGLFNDEFDFLLNKAKRYATRLEASSLGSYDSLTFYKTSFLSGAGYQQTPDTDDKSSTQQDFVQQELPTSSDLWTIAIWRPGYFNSLH
jgi:hypothetical protein